LSAAPSEPIPGSRVADLDAVRESLPAFCPDVWTVLGLQTGVGAAKFASTEIFHLLRNTVK